ncbi:hypothetical protein GCM10023086_18940 [Streptomyces venetus]|uniref:Uncharacterized protein n=1 Tax=Streptomyces venetus TaxID=1701086 RepID=A0ABP8FFI9_9ACTN
MDPPLARLGLRELEVLHGVGDIGLGGIDPRLLQRPVQQPPGRPDERLPLPILLIPGLLPYEHDPGIRIAGTEDGLRGIPVQGAAPALGSGPP